MASLSIVIPVFNEQECVPAMYARLKAVGANLAEQMEIIFVDDGSADGTLAELRKLAAADPAVRYVSFSRNFGHEAAIMAGLDHAAGDAVVTLDGDLQHPPEVIPQLVAKWHEGFQVVYAQRRAAGHEGGLKKLTSRWFYRVFRRVSDVDLPPDAANFRLMDRRVVHQLRRLREPARFLRGLVSWVGFRQTGIPYDEDRRLAGSAKYNMGKSTRLAVDAIFSFARLPARKVAAAGAAVCGLSLLAAVAALVRSLVCWTAVPGAWMVTCGLFFLGGAQLAVLGLVGEYALRAYRQGQDRPIYVVGEKSPSLPAGEEGLA